MRDCQWIIEKVKARPDWAQIESRLPLVKSAEQIATVGDDRLFSDLCRRVFRAGLKHSLVDSKWPAFERVFYGFDPARVVLMSDEQLERLMGDSALIRHWGKLKAVRQNAMMVSEIVQSHGSFARFLADWPVTDIVGLWALLTKRGAHLGGQSGAAFLRLVGKDTFRLTDDVVAALIAQQIVDKAPTARRDLDRVQAAFNTWQQQSELPLAHISTLLAHTVGSPRQT